MEQKWNKLIEEYPTSDDLTGSMIKHDGNIYSLSEVDLSNGICYGVNDGETFRLPLPEVWIVSNNSK
jgi:hypothetical protein